MKCKILTIFVNIKLVLCILTFVFLYLDHTEMK